MSEGRGSGYLCYFLSFNIFQTIHHVKEKESADQRSNQISYLLWEPEQI